MALKDVLNTNNPQQHVDALAVINLGDLLTKVIQSFTPNEAAIAVTANVATLAVAPLQLWQVNATTATVTGVKKLRQGPITGAGAIIPATGEAVWDGGTKVLFAAGDAVTAASFTYAHPTTDKASCLLSDFKDIR